MRTPLVIAALTALTAALATAGCTFADGRAFARASGRLTASFAGFDADAGRVTADGWFKTDTSFELSITALELQVREVRLTAAAAAGGASGAACSFDPADPPAGCTLCHGGHCHCGDELRSYEELEAELCGGAGSATLVATLPVDAALDLRVAGAPRALDACAPSCDLGRGAIDAVTVVLDRLVLRATLRDRSLADRLGGAELAVAVDLDLAGLALGGDLAAPALLDRDQPYELRLDLALPVAAPLLDGVAWDALERAGAAVTVDAATNAGAGETLIENLTLTPLLVTVTRAGD